MPSTHSAAIAFYASYITLACVSLPIHPSFPSSQLMRLLPPIVAIPWATAIVHSRIWLGHHTWPQCIVGCIYGTSFALGWFNLWTHGFDLFGRAIEDYMNAMIFQ